MLNAVPVVTLHVWTVRALPVPALLARTTAWRAGRPGFSKLLGTTRPGRFGLADADLLRWALLACWPDAASAAGFDRSSLARAWQGASNERWRAVLRPLSARGAWSRRRPFGQPDPAPHRGPVLVLTRARLRWRRAAVFWRAIPAAGADLADRPGLRLALGIGEAPAGWQGTLSLWESTAALRDFAYARPAHRVAMARSRDDGWYAEQLFARFAVVEADGTVDGRDPLR